MNHVLVRINLLALLFIIFSVNAMEFTTIKQGVTKGGKFDWDDKQEDLKKITSLMESFMSGKLQAKEKENKKIIVYSDYKDAAISYEDSIKDAYDVLSEVYGAVKFSIDGWAPLQIQSQMLTLKKDQKVDYLSRLSEIDKTQLQALRFYDFKENKNYFLPAEIESRVEKITSSGSSEDQIDEELAVLGKELNLELRLESVESNRKSLIRALKTENIEGINIACSKPLHFENFVSLDQAIQRMISDVKNDKGDKNTLLTNEIRASGCIIS